MNTLSHSKDEEEREDFQTFLDLKETLDEVLEEYEPSKTKVKAILHSMLECLK